MRCHDHVGTWPPPRLTGQQRNLSDGCRTLSNFPSARRPASREGEANVEEELDAARASSGVEGYASRSDPHIDMEGCFKCSYSKFVSSLVFTVGLTALPRMPLPPSRTSSSCRPALRNHARTEAIVCGKS